MEAKLKGVNDILKVVLPSAIIEKKSLLINSVQVAFRNWRGKLASLEKELTSLLKDQNQLDKYASRINEDIKKINSLIMGKGKNMSPGNIKRHFRSFHGIIILIEKEMIQRDQL